MSGDLLCMVIFVVVVTGCLLQIPIQSITNKAAHNAGSFIMWAIAIGFAVWVFINIP